MKTLTTTLATLTLAGLCATFAPAASAQPAPDPQAPPTYQPGAPQPYPGQPSTPPGDSQQPYPQQPYPGQPYQPQPYPGQPYQPQPYQPQPYYPPGQPMPNAAPQAPVRYVNQPRVGLIIGGAITLGVSWLVSCGVASLVAIQDVGSYSYQDYGRAWPLLVPVVGPWIQMGYTGNDTFSGLANTMLAFDGIVQAGGLAMLIAGAVTHTRVAVYAKNGVQVTPLMLSGSSGVLVSGRF